MLQPPGPVVAMLVASGGVLAGAKTGGGPATEKMGMLAMAPAGGMQPMLPPTYLVPSGDQLPGQVTSAGARVSVWVLMRMALLLLPLLLWVLLLGGLLVGVVGSWLSGLQPVQVWGEARWRCPGSA